MIAAQGAAGRSPKAYFFAFRFFVVFFLATFFAFFFATFGMSNDSSYVRPGRATQGAPQNAKNMSGLRLRLQYGAVSRAKPFSRGVEKTHYFTAFLVLRPFTDKFAAKAGLAGPNACKCGNHPSSGNPSRALRTTLTVAGLALPPVVFIT